MIRYRAAVVAAALAAITVAPAAAQSPTWHALPVPGGWWTLRELGVPEDIPRARAIEVIVRKLYDPQTETGVAESARLRVLAHLDALGEFQDAVNAAATPTGISLSTAATRQGRSRLEKVAELAGLDLRNERGTFRFVVPSGRGDIERRARLGAMGIDVEPLAGRVNQGEGVVFAPRTIDLPLPIAPKLLASALFEREVPPRRLFAEFVRNPRLLLFLYGLLSVNQAALDLIAADREMLRTLAHDVPGPFAAFSGRIEVQDGKVVTPGPPEAISLWQELLEQPIHQPVAFLRRLFTRDEGRLAGFFDTMARLNAAQASFALGQWLKFPDDRRNQFRALYDVFRSADPQSDWMERPFSRQPGDPAAVLQLVAASPERAGNGLLGPQWTRFWDRVLNDESDFPEEPQQLLRHVDEDGVVDPVWLIQRISLDSPMNRGERLRAFLAVQRAFPDPPASALPEVLIAAQAWLRYPALARTLDRIGVSDPALVSAMARRAEQISGMGEASQSLVPLLQFQSALAIVERLFLAGTIDSQRAHTLVQMLAAIPLTEDGYGLSIGRWLAEGVLGASLATSAGADERLLRLLAGPSNAAAPVVTWEGARYRVDAAEAEYDRMMELRARLKIAPVEPILALAAVAGEMASGARDVKAGQQLADRFRAAIAALPRVAANAAFDDAPDVARELERAARDLQRLQRPNDLQRLQRASKRATPFIEFVLAHAMASLAYLPHLGEPDSAALIAGDLSARHDFGFDAVSDRKRFVAWELAAESNDPKIGKRLSGAMLGLDAAMVEYALQRMSSEPLAAAPTLTTVLSRALMTWVAAAPASPARGVFPLQSIAVPLAQARQRLASATTPAALDAFAASAGLHGYRRRLLSWMLEHERDRIADVIPLRNLLAAAGVRAPALHAFGAVTESVDARLTLTFPEWTDAEGLAGRPATAMLALQLVDLNLRVAELLHEVGMPGELYPPVMSYAIRALIDTAQPLYSDDAVTLAHRAATFSREQIEDYISALAGRGWLRPQ